MHVLCYIHHSLRGQSSSERLSDGNVSVREKSLEHAVWHVCSVEYVELGERGNGENYVGKWWLRETIEV